MCRPAVLSIILALVVPSPKAFSQSTAQELIKAMHDAVLRHSSLEYDADLRMKFSNMGDTFSIASHVKLQRVEGDSLWGGRIHFTRGDSAWTFYDGESIYQCELATDTALRYGPKLHPQLKRFPIDQDWFTGTLWRAFLKPSMLEELLRTKNELRLMPDSTIDGVACTHVWIKEPDDGELTEISQDYFISKADHMPLLRISRLLAQRDLQYSALRLRSSVFDDLQAKDFAPARAAKDLAIVEYEIPVRDTDEFLPIGSEAPSLVGDLYGSDPALDPIEMKGQVTFIDFWYMSCPPCIASIPAIDSLFAEYHGRGVQFIGVNRWDTQLEQLDKLPAFLERHPIHYPILLAAAPVEEAYLADGHPTYYILDREGRVQYAAVGYGKGMERTWGEKIDELLK